MPFDVETLSFADSGSLLEKNENEAAQRRSRRLFRGMKAATRFADNGKTSIILNRFGKKKKALAKQKKEE